MGAGGWSGVEAIQTCQLASGAQLKRSRRCLVSLPNCPDCPALQAVRQLASGASIQEVVDRQMRSIFGDEFDHVGAGLLLTGFSSV